MTAQIVVLIDAAYAVAVAGLAMIWPPLALVGAGAFLLAQAVVADRRAES